MGVLTTSAACVAVASLLGYFALQITLLVHSIQALIGKDGLCTVNSFRWVWFICISSAVFCYNTFIQAKQHKDGQMTMASVVLTVVLTTICSLGFAIGTQLQYLDGCPAGTEAHLTMTIFMWGNYGVCVAVALVAVLVGLVDKCDKAPSGGSDMPVVVPGATPYRADAAAPVPPEV